MLFVSDGEIVCFKFLLLGSVLFFKSPKYECMLRVWRMFLKSSYGQSTEEVPQESHNVAQCCNGLTAHPGERSNTPGGFMLRN